MFYGNSIYKYQNHDAYIQGLKEFNIEFENFTRLSNSLEIVTENQIVLEQGFFQKFIEKIKEIWSKFIGMIAKFINKIKSFFFKSKEKDPVKHVEEVNKEVKNLKPEDLEKASKPEEPKVQNTSTFIPDTGKIKELEDKVKDLEDQVAKARKYASDRDQEHHEDFKKYQERLDQAKKDLEEEKQRTREANDRANQERSRANQEKERADRAEGELSKPIDLSSLTYFLVDGRLIKNIEFLEHGFKNYDSWISIDPREIEKLYDRNSGSFEKDIVEADKSFNDNVKSIAELDIDKKIESIKIGEYRYSNTAMDMIKDLSEFCDGMDRSTREVAGLKNKLQVIEDIDEDVKKRESEIDAITKMSGNEISQEVASYMIKVMQYNIDCIKTYNIAVIKALTMVDRVIKHNDETATQIENKLHLKIR